MKRKAVHLTAAIAESFRFIAVVFLAFSVGALRDASVSNLLRYAAAPQLLFAVGFFFLWLDPERYRAYRPLLAIGKAASLACALPLAVAVARDPQALSATLGIPRLGLLLASFISIVDIASLAVLFATREPAPPRTAKAIEPAAAVPAGPGPAGQGPADIERVEV